MTVRMSIGLCRTILILGSVLLLLLGEVVSIPFVSAHSITSLSQYNQRIATSTCLQPPQNMNLMTLSDVQLRLYGLPTHSTLDRNRVKWTSLLAHAKHRTCGSYVDPQKKTHHARTPLSPSTSCFGCAYNNWAGNIDDGSRGTYRLAEVDFSVPNILTTSDINSHVSIWAGVGGDSLTTSNGVLVQAGIDSSKTCGSCQYNESWWEVYPYFPEENLPLSRLNVGDQLHVLITSNDNNDSQDYFYIENYSANSYNSHTETQSNYFSDSATGECIVERPGEYGTSNLYELAAFNPPGYTEQLTNCAIGVENGGINSVGSLHHHYGYIVNSSNKTLASPGAITNNGFDFPVYWKGSY